MGKRRTRKQKEKAKHTFTIHWGKNVEKNAQKLNVKRELINKRKTTFTLISENDSLKNTEKVIDLALIKKDIAKSLFLASLILASEIVLYLFWQV